MKKIIVGIIAIAMLAIPTAAIASVAVDNGVGTVGKGDVQSALGWSNHDFDKNAAGIKFTVTSESVWHLVKRVNGVDYVSDITMKSVQPITAAPVLNSNGKQITGWSLNGVNGPAESKTEYSNMGAQNEAQLAAFLSGAEVEDHSTYTTTSSLYVNGVALPNTPVVIPAV
jgi:hypothetical protein